ncbi:leptin receptor isoform X2 [Mixophyes fleayi]|uniref:leptin receptor isoform X2 n=1 Tax=Mixophyes fleayi TaxID=3061075 RepID=UPI003F4E2D62
MVWKWILTVILLWECLVITLVSPETYRIPSSGVFLSYLSANKPLNTPLTGGIVQEIRNVQCINLGNKKKSGHGSFCLWNGTDTNYTIHEQYMEIQKTILAAFSSDIHLVDHTWTLQCWIGENGSRITCEIQYLAQETDVNVAFIPKLYYARNDRYEHRIEPDCNCLGYKVCECFIPSVTYSDSFILWMEIPDPVTSLMSPPMSIKAAAIIKPDSPSDLRIEITEEGKLKILWSQPEPLTYRLQYQVKYYLNTTENNVQLYLMVGEPYVILNVTESCSPLVFEVRCRRLPTPGIWSNWSVPTVLKSQGGFYFPQKVLVPSGSSVSVYCMYCDNNRRVPSKDITWGLKLEVEIPSKQYTTISDYISKVTFTNLNTTIPQGKFHYDALYCCAPSVGCQPRYAEVYVVDVNISITCETNGRLTVMTCRWSAKQIAALKETNLTFQYYQNINYCFEMDINYGASISKSCALKEDGFYECVFNPIRTTYSYYMWVEVRSPMGTLKSTPVCVRPSDVAKPNTPLEVQAEITADTEHLHVSWRKPEFALFDVMYVYQVRYRVQGQETEWQVLDIYKNEFADIPEVDACEPYTVQIRCKAIDVSEYWSDWSNPVNTMIKDVRAPLKGPEFWRFVQKNIIQKGDNITLIWQPVQKEQLLCSVRGYEILHQVSNTVSWSESIGNATNYTFSLQHSAVIVTVRALNSLGHSKVNRHLTLSERMSAVKAVKSLDVYPLNSSAVAVWNLFPVPYEPLEFVLEWRNLRENAQVRWAFIPPNVSKYYFEDQFFFIEKYQFSLTPVFLEGISSTKTTYEFSKDEMQNNAGLYVILPVITATSFLLAITLAISHQRMKQMFWKDVPNPKYCSWAQGVNFQKPDTLEHLFIKHHEHLVHSFPLILEPEGIFENLNTDKDWEKEDLGIISIVDRLRDDRDSACATSHFSSGCTYAEEAEGSMYRGSTCQSSVKYATIISNPQQTKQCISGRKMSASSCDGCFLKNNSIVIGNLEDEKRAFLIMAGLQTKQPSKTSSNSTVSSEGFSEPSDPEGSFEGDILENNVYYVGIDSIQNNEHENYFSENPLVTYHLQENISYQEMDFRKDKSSEFIDNNYVHRSLVKKSLHSYMPQFQIQSTSDLEMF